MAGPARDAGWPDTSSSSASGFIPEVWSGKLVTKFYATTMFGECANTDYEGEIKGLGDNVIIRTVPDITISDYTIGGGLTYERPVSPKVELPIDKAKSFSFECSDIEEHQADINKMDAWSDDASHQMRIAIDTDILANVYTDAATENKGATAGVKSAAYDMGTAVAPLSLTKDNIIEFLVNVGSVADEQNWPDEERYIVLPVWAVGLIKQSDLKDASLAGDSKSILRTGMVGMIDRLKIYKSNNVDGTAAATNAIAGHKKALTFASQMTKMEDLPNPDDFGQLVRGLNVYGYKVVDGKKLIHAVIAKG